MKLVRFYCTLIALKIFNSQLTPTKDFELQNVSKFVGALVRDAATSEPQQTFDIALLKMMKEPEIELYDRIAIEISPAVVFFVDCSKPSEVIYRVSMIIVVTDDTDPVRLKICT